MRNAVIGQAVRVKRGALVRHRGERATLTRPTAGTVRQVWRGDRLALVELRDADPVREAWAA